MKSERRRLHKTAANNNYSRNKQWMNDLVKIGMKLVCKYACEESPFSLGVLGSTLTRGFNEACNRSMFVFDEEKTLLNCGQVLLGKCGRMARSGNWFAQNVMNSLELPY